MKVKEDVKETVARIEQWREWLGTKPSTFEGVKMFKNWKPGKEVTKEVYEGAVSAFQCASMDSTGKEETC